MALIRCKRCGHVVSTRARRCPACGRPVQPPRKSRGVWKLVLFLMLAAGAAGLYGFNEYNRRIEREQELLRLRTRAEIDDSLARIARREQLRDDSLRTMAARRSFSSADLTLFSLHADVKSVISSGTEIDGLPSRASFTPEGKWVEAARWSDDDLRRDSTATRRNYERLPQARIGRDAHRRIVRLYSLGGSGNNLKLNTVELVWDHERVMASHGKIHVDYYFNADGMLERKVEACTDADDGRERTTTYTDYVFDDMGNWIKRTRHTVTLTASQLRDGEEPRTARRADEHRSITYYKK